MAYHDNKRTGDIISTVTNDIDSIQSAVSSGMLDALYYSLTLIGMIGIMFYLDWRFTLVALSVLPALFLVVYTFTKRIKKASRALRKKEAEMVSTLQEVLSSIRIVKAFGREEYEQKRFEDESIESVDLALQARNIKAKLCAGSGNHCGLRHRSGTVVRVKAGLERALTPGVLVVFFLYLGKMYKPIRELSKMSDTYSKALIGWERIKDFLAIDLQVRDLPGAQTAPNFKGAIELEHVNFGYLPGRMVLKDVSLKVQPGQVAALVGATGSGKSTLISLIPRFYDPQTGAVKIDGVDVRKYQRKTVRQQISLVLQDTLLFRAPIWQNIAYGKPEATHTEIVEAARLANADEFIDRLPDGYNTMIGERGVTLSGGQRQRIAIARAIIRNSPILILDEPSTGLDAASEKLVLEGLGATHGKQDHHHGRASAGHHPESGCDFRVADGAIVERGRHEELLAADGLYAQFYHLQSQKRRRTERESEANPLLGGVTCEVG